MFARTVRIQLKPNSVAEFTRTLANDIIPLLRHQPGFQDEITFVVPDGTKAVSISVWNQQANTATYAARLPAREAPILRLRDGLEGEQP